jgi:soluble lytic murein transglycosylase
MASTIRLTLALLLLCPALAGAADPLPNPMPAIHADRWADAAAAAGQYADPVAQKLVTYYRLLAPGAATAPEIAAFVASSPDWPAQAQLERHRQEAIATDPDDAEVLALCAPAPATVAPPTRPAPTTPPDPITLPAARLRCADALANAGHTAQAAAEARRAWITGFAADPADFPQRWRVMLRQADHWDRFQALALSDPTAAARDLPLLDPAHRALAAARLGLQRDAPDAAALLAAVPRALTDDPGLMLAQAGWLRRAERIPDAVALWRARGAAAQRAATPTELAAFWPERERLARHLLRGGPAPAPAANPADAYALVDDPDPIPPRQAIDADFFAGFIALRLLHQPEAATRHFQALAAASPAAITQARAWYWLGRAAAAQTPSTTTVTTNAAQPDTVPTASHDPARAAYAKAAAFPTTFYGQLAALALGDDPKVLAARIDALRDPPAASGQAFDLTQREVVRAAALLAAWGEPRRAETFLLRMDDLAPDLADRALTARLALFLGQPQAAVAIARRMGRDGTALPQSGWPTPIDPPADSVDPAIVLGLIRQESSFDSSTVSPAGALGLMQLMPNTAATLAHAIGTKVTPVALVFEPGENIRLGTAYLRELLDRYNNTLPLALAAYNAGPGRVDQWLAQNGDPHTAPSTAAAAGTPKHDIDHAIDMVDWIELIPFDETRNYVQRVLENVVIYRARRGEATPTLLAQWTR